MKQKAVSPCLSAEVPCAKPEICPLSRIRAGELVCIKKLSTAPELKQRLRELGLIEEQTIKVVSHQSNYICAVCNARLGISEKLADVIMVQPVEEASAMA